MGYSVCHTYLDIYSHDGIRAYGRFLMPYCLNFLTYLPSNFHSCVWDFYLHKGRRRDSVHLYVAGAEKLNIFLSFQKIIKKPLVFVLQMRTMVFGVDCRQRGK